MPNKPPISRPWQNPNKAKVQPRKTANERGYGAKWQQAREGFLAKHPLCVVCLKTGQVTPGIVVDHIIPHKGNMQIFWDSNNWQTLCIRHHNEKTAKGL